MIEGFHVGEKRRWTVSKHLKLWTVQSGIAQRKGGSVSLSCFQFGFDNANLAINIIFVALSGCYLPVTRRTLERYSDQCYLQLWRVCVLIVSSSDQIWNGRLNPFLSARSRFLFKGEITPMFISIRFLSQVIVSSFADKLVSIILQSDSVLVFAPCASLHLGVGRK